MFQIRTSLNAELLERADKLSVEVSVLSLRERRSRRLYRCCGRKSELVDSCDGVYSEVISERFDNDVEDFRRGFSGGYVLEEVVLISDETSMEVSGYIQYQECVQD